MLTSTEVGTTSQQVVKFWAETAAATPRVKMAERIFVENGIKLWV
jgi:hypothetical protein